MTWVSCQRQDQKRPLGEPYGLLDSASKASAGRIALQHCSHMVVAAWCCLARAGSRASSWLLGAALLRVWVELVVDVLNLRLVKVPVWGHLTETLDDAREDFEGLVNLSLSSEAR